MPPLLLCGVGTLFVLVVVNVRGIDVVPDAVGLAVYAVGMLRVAGASLALVAAGALAALTAVVRGCSLVPGLVGTPLAAGVDVTATVTGGLALALGAFALGRRAHGAQDRLARPLRTVGVLLGLGVCLFAIGWLSNARNHAVALDLIALSRLTGAVGMLTFVVLLVAAARREWAHPDAASPTGDAASGSARSIASDD